MDIYNIKKENQSLTNIIFDKIRDDILNNKYEEGDKLVESKLAEELGVSRTPIREALKQLELDGLVENLPNRGVIVKGLSINDIEDIYIIRMNIEVLAAKWSVERANASDIDELKEIYELMEFYTVKRDVDKIFDLNTRFHEKIYKIAHSRFLENVLKDFQTFIKPTRVKSLSVEGRLETALIEHKEILDAFMDRNAARAMEALKNHIMKSMMNFKNNI